jgi:rRNA maturation RNase YbeY
MITFASNNTSYILKNKKAIKSWIYNCIHSEKKSIECISIVFCSDEELLKINIESLNHHYYTDIITFELNEPSEPIVGDIYISIDRIKENAKNLNLSVKEEVLRVIIHGVLHLCGYKDKKTIDKEQMTQKENFYIHRFLVPRGTK